MNGYVKIVVGLIVVAAPGLFLSGCTPNMDIPSASDNAVPTTLNAEVPKGPDDVSKRPESGEGDFAQH